VYGRLISDADKACWKAGGVDFVRRLGRTPQQRGSLNNGTCPDIFELSDGSFAVIGTDRTDELESKLPPGAARADYERIVVVTRDTLVYAKRDIPRRVVAGRGLSVVRLAQLFRALLGKSVG
jgi:hypothetical protein